MTSQSGAQGGDVLRRGFGVLGRAIREEPVIFGIAVAGSAVYGTMTVAAAWVLGRVTDRVIVPAFEDGRTTAGALLVGCLAIVAVAVLKAAGIVARRLGAGVMQYRLQAAYRRRVTRQYLTLPLSWHQRHPTGQLLSNANADVEATWYVIAPLPMAVGVLVMLVVAGVAMLLTDLVLALVGFLVFPAIFGLNVVYQRRLSPLATRAQQLRAEVSEVAHESFDGALVVKTLGREAEETRRFGATAGELRDANVGVGRVRGAFDPMLEALPNLGVLAVLVVGTSRIASGAIGAGDLVQIAYLFILLAFPVRAIGWVLGELPRSVVGWDRISAVIRATGALPYGAAHLPDGRAPSHLDVRTVRFAYLGDEHVLRDVSFDVEPGRTVAVVGPTGSGKSTLANLLVRLVDPSSGAVLLDGVDLRDVRRGGVAGSAAMVGQQTFLFDDTVRGNVTLGADIDDVRVWDALRLAQANDFVAALPGGLDTRVGERGTSLSGGQRQRVALARALVRRPRLLVLDDATSSVDPLVEARILAGLREAALPSTVVVVAYRQATIGLADEVVYVEHGRVLARGSHERLLAESPGYRLLVTAYERAEADRQAARAAESQPA
ncbi:MAG: ABC transporter ATP-binding protein/permease [Actinomycetota bacterium]|nr:ABC transporter ATP-binding protein/permease [Actinomycetota bacterium]